MSSDSEGNDSGAIKTNVIQPNVARPFPAKSPVDREQARMLVSAVGYQDAAQRLGVAANTLYQWANRFGWHKSPVHSQQTVRSVRPPSEALQDALADMSRKTKVQLARVVLRSARSVKSVPVRSARDLKDLQTAAAGVHGWGESKADGGITLNVLNVQGDLIQG